MKRQGEGGYVLASVLAVLLAISLVAAALVSTTADGLRDARAAEADASAMAVLRSAIVVVSSEIALDPRRRRLDIDAEKPALTVLGREVAIRAAWESAKLDVNLAPVEDIREALEEADIPASIRGDVEAAVRQAKAKEMPILLLDGVLPASADRGCLQSILTVFGGRPKHEPDSDGVPVRIGRPAAGARVSVEVWLTDQPQQGLEAVLLMTGDPAAPAKILDWRRIRQGGKERCHV